MSPEISTSTQAPIPRLSTTDFTQKKNTADQGTMQKVRQAQAEQQRAARNTAAAQAAAQESQNNLRATQAEERHAAERVSLAQAEHQKNTQPRQTQTTGKIINVLA